LIAPLRSFPALLRKTAALLLAATLSACATFRNYDAELSHTINLAAGGNLDGAIKWLDRNNKRGKKDLLYYFELGELERLRNRYDESKKAWMEADVQLQMWERTAATNPEKLASNVASVFINDKSRPYEGHDFEKVMLSTRLALDHLARGDFDSARVDIKRTHEREVLVASLREKELRKTEEEARKRGVQSSFKELNGYPVQSIDNPEVNTLRNSYQSAFSHYLAGYVYEALGEPSLAAAGYRQAIELRPNEPLLEHALAGLDSRAAARDDGYTDVLFVVESGTAPARKSQQFNLPFFQGNRTLIVPVSFPVIAPALPAYMPSQLQIAGENPIDVVAITSIDLMTRKALQEEMPGILLRGIIRSTAKAVAQSQAAKSDESGLAAFGMAIGSIITESADERAWRSLPAQIAIARTRVPSGEHTMTLQTSEGVRSLQLNLAGRHAVVGLRLLRSELFVQSPKAVAPGGGQQSTDARAAPAPSTGDRPETLEQQPHTVETSK
jgi:uncharacterized protein